MTVLRPLPGDAGTVRVLADRLASQGERMLCMAASLRGLVGPDVSWEGPSEAAFAERAGLAASLLVAAGRRHGVSAAALRPLAAALEHAQRVVGAAVEEHGIAYPRAVALGNARVEAQQSADPAMRATAVGLHAREVSELERARDAERSHGEGWRQFHEADRRCAAVLGRLLDDGLADSRAYDALTGLGRAAAWVEGAAGAVAVVPIPQTKAVGAVAGSAGLVSVLTDTTVRVAYGDGDWVSIGVSAAAATTGPLSKVLKRGALATNPAAQSALTRADRRLLRHGVGTRLRTGALGELRQVGRPAVNRPPRVVTPMRPPGSSPTAAAHWVAEQVTERARRAARVRWLDDLVLVTRDPQRSRRMLLTGWGAEAAGAGLRGAEKARDLQLGHEQRKEKGLRDQRHGVDVPGAPPRPR